MGEGRYEIGKSIYLIEYGADDAYFSHSDSYWAAKRSQVWSLAQAWADSIMSATPAGERERKVFASSEDVDPIIIYRDMGCMIRMSWRTGLL